MSFPVIERPFLPSNTVIPEDPNLFISYLNNIYEQIAFAANQKDWIYYPISITNTAANITNIPNFGSYIVCVSGADIVYPATNSGLPCIVAALSKASVSSAGVVAVITSQAGNIAPWVAATLTISSTATNFQIAHSLAATTGNFNIRVIGTQ